MDRTIDLETARATLDEIMRAAAEDGERVIIEQPGLKPVVLARLVDDDRHTAFGQAVTSIRTEAATRGLDKMTMDEIDAEIESYRQEKTTQQAGI